MFEALLDLPADDPNAAVFAVAHEGPVAAPPPAAAAAAAPRRRAQRGGVQQHGESAINKIKLSWACRKLASSQASNQRLLQSQFTSFSDHAAAVTFGHKTESLHRKTLMLRNGTSTAHFLSKSGNRSESGKSMKQYGLVGVAAAQAAGLQKFLDEASPGKLIHFISASTFDDSAAWLKDPASAADRASGIRVEGTKLKTGQLWRRGNNVSLPVFNMTESIITHRQQMNDDHELVDIWRAALIHSPSQVLPRANTATIANRRDRWMACGVSGSGGALFDYHDSLTSGYCSGPAWHTIISTKDNLALNDLILGMDEAVIRQSLEDGLHDSLSTPTMLGLSCLAHSCVLTTKLVTNKLDDLPGKLVKMGHIHESGKVSTAFKTYIDSIVDDRFDFIPVPELPPECTLYRIKSANILKNTRMCLDLGPADEDFILDVDNGDWDAERWVHYCTGMPCRCKGDKRQALRFMKLSAQLSIGKMETTPLAYRWKGVERFIGKTYRGRRQHDAYLEAHLRLFPKSVTRRSLEAVEALSATDAAAKMSNDQLRHKQNIRGGQTVDFMESDAGGRTLELALVLNTGVQHYLNKVYAADALVTKFMELLQRVPNESTAPPADIIKTTRQQCIDKNLELISGDAGRCLLEDYSAMFDFAAESWSAWRLNYDERFQSCLDMLCVMQDGFWRLVLKLDVAQLKLLDVGRITPGDIEAVKAIALRVRQSGEQCLVARCLDAHVTLPWLSRLLDHGDSMTLAAHGALLDILASMRVGSPLVEKKHLHGQESKPAKRGVCIGCDTIGGLVLRRLVTAASDQTRRAVTEDHLGKHYRSFAAALGDHAQEGHADRRSEVAAGSSKAASRRSAKVLNFESKLSRHKTRGYDVYVSRNYCESLPGATTFEKRKVLDGRWKSLSAAEQAIYNSTAEAQDAEDSKFHGESFVEFTRRQAGSLESVKKGRKTARLL